MGLPPGHRFPARKYRILRELLTGNPGIDLRPAPLAPAVAIGKAHSPAYVEAFLAGTLDAAAIRRIGFPWSPGLVTRTLASVGGTLAAAHRAAAVGLSGTLAGGTHHAAYEEGSGFCVFNDIAVAIRSLRDQRCFRRFAVLDLDVHQGDGTAQIFAGDQEVFTLSLHGRNNFPFRKQTSSLDIDFADGAGDGEYLEALDGALQEVEAFAPEFLFFQSGVDALASDTLGKLSLTPEGLAERDHRVLGFARKLGTPLVITLGGGYANPIEESAAAHATTFRLAAASGLESKQADAVLPEDLSGDGGVRAEPPDSLDLF